MQLFRAYKCRNNVNVPPLILMAKVIGKSGPRVRLPGFINWTAGKCGDLVASVTGHEPLVNSAATQMGSLFHYYDSAKAAGELGYKIGSVDTALIDAWEWFKKFGYAR